MMGLSVFYFLHIFFNNKSRLDPFTCRGVCLADLGEYSPIEVEDLKYKLSVFYQSNFVHQENTQCFYFDFLFALI